MAKYTGDSTKYHIGDDGQPRLCTAKIKCPKGSETLHFFGSKTAAHKWAEEQNAERAGGSFSSQKRKTSIENTGNRKVNPYQSMEDQEKDYTENIVPNSDDKELVSDFRSSSGLSAVTDSELDRINAEKQANIVIKEIKSRLQNNVEGDVFFDREKVKVKTYDDSKYVRETLPEMSNDTLVDHYSTRAGRLAEAKVRLDLTEGIPSHKDTDTYLDYVEQEKHARRELEERLAVAEDKKP